MYSRIDHQDPRTPDVSAATVASIQTVFQRSRLGHNDWRSRQLEGRIDARNVWRNSARGSVDIFKERRAPSATKLNIHLLVDGSGSMSGGLSIKAQDLVATLTEAFKFLPTVRLTCWQHNANTGQVNLTKVYERGTVNRINKMHRNTGGGNADGFALLAVGQRALKNRRIDERTMVIVISDGRPSVHGTNNTNYHLAGHSKTVAGDLRQQGVTVLSVAVEGGSQADMYGTENVISFTGSDKDAWSDLARDFAQKFGAALR